MIRIRAAAAVLALAVLTQPASAQLVTNGGFETGDFSGWTLAGSSCAHEVNSLGAAHSGTYGLLSGPVGGTCSYSQNIATTAGQQYTFSFWVRNLNGGQQNSFDASWDGVSVFSTVNSSAFGYTQQMFIVAATAPTTLIEFEIRHDPDFYTLDDVSVERTDGLSTVPEPSTYALMAAGLLGIVAARRRRRVA